MTAPAPSTAYERQKRTARISRLVHRCNRCQKLDTDPPGGVIVELCDDHRCSGVTVRRRTRCTNAATYPESGVCGIHLDPAGEHA